MATLPNMGLITPELGADIGVWDDKLNADLALLDVHNHTPGKGIAIPIAGLDINDDLAMGGHGVTGLGQAAFTPVDTLAEGSTLLFVDDSDNELYWRSAGGVNVKLTSGGSINTSLVGGIVGDYSTVGAEVAYDDANQRYTFKDESAPTKKWARLAAGPVRIHEHDTTESVYVEHAVAAGLAAPYTVTWPAALPAAQALLQVDTSGNVSFTNTLATDQDLTLQGTGHIKRGEQEDIFPFTSESDWTVVSGSVPSDTGVYIQVPANTVAQFRLRIGNVKTRLKAIKVYGRAFSSTAVLSLKAITFTAGSGTVSQSTVQLSGADTVDATAEGTYEVYTLTIDNPDTFSGVAHQTGGVFFLQVDTSAGGTFGAISYGVVTDIVE